MKMQEFDGNIIVYLFTKMIIGAAAKILHSHAILFCRSGAQNDYELIKSTLLVPEYVI